MNVFDRPMFRKKGRATGIMASGPELIKKANGGTFSFGNIPPAISPIPIRQNIPSVFEQAFPLTGNRINVGSSGLMGVEGPSTSKAKQTELERLTELAQVRNPFIKKQKQEAERKGDLTVDSLGDINQTNQNILDKKPKSPEAKNLGARFDQNVDESGLTGGTDDGIRTEEVETPDKKTTSTNVVGGSTLDKELKLTNDMIARNRAAISDLSNLDDQEFFGTTVNKTTEDLFTEMKKQGKEVTLADVRDKGVKLLGFDPEKLDEQFDEDRRSSIFLRIMQAGLAIAAGESDNAITNIAKGLSVGLNGYGEDVKFLTKELKADRREAANTMYKLLGDAKSEQLAKEALNLKKKMSIQQILSTKVGDEKNNLLKEVELKNANDSLYLNFLATMRDQKFKEKEFSVKRAEFDKTLNLNLQKLTTNELKSLFEMGEVTLIDEKKGLIPGNFTMSEKGKKLMLDILENDFGGKLLAKEKPSLEQKILSKEGQVKGIVMGEGFDERSFGVKADAFVNKFNKLRADDDPMAITLDYLDLAQDVKGKIKLSQVPLIIQQELLRPPTAAQKARGETETLLEKYANRFDENDEAFKREFNL